MPAKKVSSIKKQVTGKKEVVKTEVKAPKVSETSNKIEKKAVSRSLKSGDLSVTLYSLLGKAAGDLSLPKEIFGEKVNKALLTQAMRVYQNNLKSHHSSTKTRGEVQGSTRKIGKQKGGGRARHGSIMAPIFVGGGIALGPKPRSVNLEMPAKMRSKALISALSQRASEQNIVGVSGLEKATGKTKEFAKLVEGLGFMVKGKSVLFITGDKAENATRAAKNLTKVSLKSAQNINAYEVISHTNLVLTKDGIESLQKRLETKNG